MKIDNVDIVSANQAEAQKSLQSASSGRVKRTG
jgi:hypothetical protein